MYWGGIIKILGVSVISCYVQLTGYYNPNLLIRDKFGLTGCGGLKLGRVEVTFTQEK